MRDRPLLLASLSVLIATCAGCNSADRDIQTPEGGVSGPVAGPFVVLGVMDKATSTLNRTDAFQPFLETIKINVPFGTEVIVPSLRGFELGYGSSDPEDLSTMPKPESTYHWDAKDHHLGLENVNVAVTDIDAPDVSAGTQTATIQVTARLNDDNADDPWFGVIRYELLFLGRQGAASGRGAERPLPPPTQ